MARLKEELEEKDRLQNELNKANEQMEVMAVENDRLQEGIKTNGDQETEGHELNQKLEEMRMENNELKSKIEEVSKVSER